MDTSLCFMMVLIASTMAGCQRHGDQFFSGYAEAEYVRLASPIGGTLQRLHVKRGDTIDKGRLIFELEQEAERAARDEAAAHVAREEARLENLIKGKRPDEVLAIQAQISAAEASRKLASQQLARQQQLVRSGFVSAAAIDEARTAYNQASQRVSELTAQLRIARSGARPDEIDAARQDVAAAGEALAQAEWKLKQKRLDSPAHAQVIDILYQEGELVPPASPVVTLLPPANIKARFFVPEPMLGKLRIGTGLTLRCDQCDAPIAARVSYISPQAEYTSPLIYSRENRANLVFMIEALPASDQARRLHPGQPLEIRLTDAPAKL